MNPKKAWGVVNKGTMNITEAFNEETAEPSGCPAIFKTREIARDYVRGWHGSESHKVMVVRVAIVEYKPLKLKTKLPKFKFRKL